MTTFDPQNVHDSAPLDRQPEEFTNDGTVIEYTVSPVKRSPERKFNRWLFISFAVVIFGIFSFTAPKQLRGITFLSGFIVIIIIFGFSSMIRNLGKSMATVKRIRLDTQGITIYSANGKVHPWSTFTKFQCLTQEAFIQAKQKSKLVRANSFVSGFQQSQQQLQFFVNPTDTGWAGLNSTFMVPMPANYQEEIVAFVKKYLPQIEDGSAPITSM